MNTRKGAVKGNTIVFDEPLGLPDGARVDVEVHLADNERKRTDADPKTPFRVKPNNSGFVEGVETVRLNQLLADFDTEEFMSSNKANITPSPDAMSLEAAYGLVEPMKRPEDFKEITAIAKQAKAEKTAQDLNDA